MKSRQTCILISFLLVKLSLSDQILDLKNDEKTDPLLKTHGVCMALGWGLFIPLAVSTALIRAFPGTKIFKKDAWFQLHLLLNIAGTICVVITGLLCFHIVEAFANSATAAYLATTGSYFQAGNAEN